MEDQAMLLYIETKDESTCCGCRACEQKCPKNAISMINNREGFLYPELNESLCIQCGMCERVCPIMNKPKVQNKVDNVFAIQLLEAKTLQNSSSGGAFRLLADHIIDQNGYVIGCVWGKDFKPYLEIAKTKKQLLAMQGSKYVSSDTIDIYKQVQKLLNKDCLVLFSGSPCQCAGLLNYIKGPVKNLITVDFLCHGMPSYTAFNEYVSDIAKRKNVDNFETYSFRDKEKKGWGLVSSYTWKKRSRIKKEYSIGKVNPYIYGYINGYFNRYSCYSCKFSGSMRNTDFTICDFWGVDDYHSEFNSNGGVSAIFCNTGIANEMIESLSSEAYIVRTSASKVARDNASLLNETSDIIPTLRKTIYCEIEERGWRYVSRKHLRVKGYLVRKTWYCLPNSVTSVIRKFKHNKG